MFPTTEVRDARDPIPALTAYRPPARALPDRLRRQGRRRRLLSPLGGRYLCIPARARRAAAVTRSWIAGSVSGTVVGDAATMNSVVLPTRIRMIPSTISAIPVALLRV